MTTFVSRRVAVTLAALAALGLAETAAQAQSFAPGTLVVSQVGTTGSTTALTSAATQVYLDSFTTAAAQASPLSSVPVTGLTNSGTATSEGALTLSSNGQYLLLAGYNAPVGTAAVASSASPAVYRGTAEVNAAGTVSTSFFTDGTFSGNNIRSTASVNGTTLYSAGPVGLFSTAFGSGTGTAAETGTANIRVTNIANNNLYFSTASTASATNQGPGIYDDGKVGTQTSGTTATAVLAAGAASTNAYDFLFTNPNTLFVADATAGLLEYTSATGADGTFTLASTLGTPGLTSIASNGTDIFGITSASSANSLLDFNIASSTFATLATAGANTAFRGVDLAPTAAPVTAPVPEASTTVSLGLLLMLGLGGMAVAKKRTARA